MNLKGKKAYKPTGKKPLRANFFFNCIDFLQFSSILTLKDVFGNKEIRTNSKA